MTAKVCVRTHNAGECTRALVCASIYARKPAGALLWIRDGCLLRGDGGPADADETAAVARYKLILAGRIALPTTTTAWRALFINTHTRTHARTPLF